MATNRIINWIKPFSPHTGQTIRRGVRIDDSKEQWSRCFGCPNNSSVLRVDAKKDRLRNRRYLPSGGSDQRAYSPRFGTRFLGHEICPEKRQCCLPRHSVLFCARSRRRTERTRCAGLARFQQRAIQAMIGTCPRPIACNADMIIAFKHSYALRVT